MNTHGVEVFDGTHDDAIARMVAYDFHLELFPSLHALLDKHLSNRREIEALGHDGNKLV